MESIYQPLRFDFKSSAILSEIARATGISEVDMNNAMLKLCFSDIASMISGKKKNFQIGDVMIGGTAYYLCTSGRFRKHSNACNGSITKCCISGCGQ